jgi:hypothetical protein
VRGLTLQGEVKIGLKNREELKAFLMKELDEELPEEKAKAIESTLRAFGTVPKDFNFRSFMVALLTEQISGFYDTKTKQLYLIQQKKEPGFWDKLLGTEGKDDPEEMMVISHEITHAIQDQHFDLENLDNITETNDDRKLAMQTLVEGDATLSMLDFQIRPNHFLPENTFALRLTFSMQGMLSGLTGGKELNAAPMIIRETLFFPYIEGLFFCIALRKEDHWTKINQAFKNLPASTEHILHPEKYIQGNDFPYDFDLPNLSADLGENWKEVYNNIWGEFSLHLLFREFKIENNKSMSEGWGGDRYSVLQNSDNLATIWLTVWDSPLDAQEFFSGYRQVLNKKHLSAKVEHSKGLAKWEEENFTTVIVLTEKKVNILENIPKDKCALLLEKISSIEPVLSEK